MVKKNQRYLIKYMVYGTFVYNRHVSMRVNGHLASNAPASTLPHTNLIQTDKNEVMFFFFFFFFFFT